MKICLACTHGGHLAQMMQLIGAYKGYDYFFVTFKSDALTGLRNAYFLQPKYRRLGVKLTIFLNIFPILVILIKERPNVIISTGGGEIAVPFCYIGKLLGMKIIYIESLSRIIYPSKGGKLVYPVADLFLVQWQSLLEKYGKKAKYWGKVI